MASLASDARFRGIHASSGMASEAANYLQFLDRPSRRIFHPRWSGACMPDGEIQAVQRGVKADLRLVQHTAIFVDIGLSHGAEAKRPEDWGRESSGAITDRICDSFPLPAD